MPFIHMSTSKELTADQLFAARELIARLVTLLPTKTKENTMIKVEGGCCLSIGEPDAPCLFVDARLFRASPLEAKQAFVKALCEAFEAEFSIAQNRMYVNILELDSWGSKGSFNVI